MAKLNQLPEVTYEEVVDNVIEDDGKAGYSFGKPAKKSKGKKGKKARKIPGTM